MEGCGLDYILILQVQYLLGSLISCGIVVDAWFEMIPMVYTSTTATAEKLHVLFAQFGFPDTLVSNDGTNLMTKEFAEC